MLWLGFVLSLFCCCCYSLHLIEALSQYNLLSSGNSDTSAIGAMTTAATFSNTADSNNWQPMSSNWLIVQTSTGLHAYDSNRSGINEKLQRPQHLYGRHATVVTPQHNLVEPYIMTFSKVPTKDVSRKESYYAQQVADSFYNKQRQRLAVNDAASYVVPPTTSTDTIIDTEEPPLRQIPQEIGNRKLSLDVDAVTSSSTSLSSSSSSTSSLSSPSSSFPLIIKATVSQQQSSNKSEAIETNAVAQIIQDIGIEKPLNDFLLSYNNVFAYVEYFFSVVKNVIGVSEADAMKQTKSRKLKGHEEVSKSAATSTSATTTLSIGTSRKMKRFGRKFKKFMLPLLLAYKLKFLALIPLLIGGLTLLVGTTGLAGFFFALFTAVMSLKTAGDAKSLVVKKIY